MTTKNNNNLIIVTIDYPFGALADVFLNEEIPYLSNLFDSIVIVPRTFPTEDQRVERKLPTNVFVDSSLIQRKPQRNISKLIKFALLIGRSKYVYYEVIRKSNVLRHISSIKRMVSYLDEALYVQSWVLQYIEQNNPDLTRTVFYTYWMDGATMGVGLAKDRYSEIKLVSRAHRVDLYEEETKRSYLPFRLSTLSPLNYLYLISEHGKTYISKQFPSFKSKYMVSRLGVRATGFTSKASADGIFRVVSCSNIISVKRIQLIILGLKEFGVCRPDLKFEWVHIGYGPLQEEMEKFADIHLPKNVNYQFLGFLPNSPVTAHYKDNPVDVFINVSASEGIPVTIMEAQSCGIPVIATAVGGTPEIVSENVGRLISENPSPTEIAGALRFFVDYPDFAKQMRSNSIMNWDNRYNASKNFIDFANSLKII
jgi:colanic acid/amylovoran biosynthesis glycosyltransferase